MIDIMPDDKEISKALNVLNSISDKLRYEKICEISEAQKNTYKKLLEKFKQLHDITPTDNAPKNLLFERGQEDTKTAAPGESGVPPKEKGRRGMEPYTNINVKKIKL